ncbi:MAG: hypothetical protein ACQEXJ_19490 [Myxococcota bacterium]
MMWRVSRPGDPLLRPALAGWLAALVLGLSADVRAGAPDPTAGVEAVEGAPLPGTIRNRTVDERRPGQALLWVPRLALFVPRMLYEVATEPLRLLSMAQERYRLDERVTEFFFNEEGTFGAYPTAFMETGFGLNVGARIIHKDLFGRSESLRLRAGFGGLFKQAYTARLASGNRLPGGAVVALQGGYEVTRSNRFFGLGNGEPADDGALEQPIDLREEEVFARSVYRLREAYGTLTGSVRLSERLKLRLTHRWSSREVEQGDLGPGGEDWLSEVYLDESLPGSDVPLVSAYTELRADVDTTRTHSVVLPRALPSAGWQVNAWAGWQQGVAEDPSRFARVGLDVQPYLDLFGGDRVLRLRLRLVGALARREHIPFMDLPTLGGPFLLRGYLRDRFRGRLTGLTTVEYRWPVQPNFAAYVFMDAGRAWADFDDVTLAGTRVGFGGGLLVFTPDSFVMGFHVASSRDGGVFFNLILDPVHDPRETY